MPTLMLVMIINSQEAIN